MAKKSHRTVYPCYGPLVSVRVHVSKLYDTLGLNAPSLRPEYFAGFGE